MCVVLTRQKEKKVPYNVDAKAFGRNHYVVVEVSYTFVSLRCSLVGGFDVTFLISYLISCMFSIRSTVYSSRSLRLFVMIVQHINLSLAESVIISFISYCSVPFLFHQ